VIKIQNALYDNDYLSNQTNTSFTVLLNETIQQNIEFKKLKKEKYIHGLLKYPTRWPLDLDLFSFIKKEYIDLLRKKEIYFIFDASTEGFSPIVDFLFFDILYNNCFLHNIDPSRIIFVSSNLLDEKNLEKYCIERHVKNKINIFSFVAFEYAIQHRHGFLDTETYLQEKIKIVNKKFKDKYFSSLSRVNRPHRIIATFLLCQEDIKQKALISHNSINLEEYKYILSDFDQAQIQAWIKTLPLIVDQQNFNINWALDQNYFDIHDQTLFQIVNETEANNKFNTCLFYSEKTFRPISQLQPFIIYGQKNCNQNLKNLKYKIYDDYFDYSFDSIEDDVKRYKSLLNSVKDLCSRLDSMDKNQKIEWRFKNYETLIHNYNTLFNKTYSKTKAYQFLSDMLKAQSK